MSAHYWKLLRTACVLLENGLKEKDPPGLAENIFLYTNFPVKYTKYSASDVTVNSFYVLFL
jgi:hypothetical protein